MASFVFTRTKRDLMKGDMDFDAAGADIRAILVMTNTTADTEEDTTTIAGFTTLDEFDGSSYTTVTGLDIGTQVVNEDTANDRAEFDSTNITFSGVGAGTRLITGMVIFRFVTNFNSSIPIAYVDFSSTPGNFAANGGDISITWDAQGIIQAT